MSIEVRQGSHWVEPSPEVSTLIERYEVTGVAFAAAMRVFEASGDVSAFDALPSEGGAEIEIKVWARIAGFDDWRAQLVIRQIEGTLVTSSFTIEKRDGADPRGGLTSEILRSVPLGAVPRELNRLIGLTLPKRPVAQLAEDFHKAHRPGRRGRGDGYYAEVAAAYVSRLDSSSALADLADELALSPSQARNLLYAARRKGLLTEAPGGKAGGQLTDKAKDLLNGQHQAS